MKKRLIVINFKTYKKATGEKALKLAKVIDNVSKEQRKYKFIIAVQATDIYRISKEVGIDVYAQHIDAVEEGTHTGHITALSVKQAGAKGVLLNHSEIPLTVDEIEGALREAKYNGMKVIVCASDAEVGGALSELLPDFVAVEPPELIGGKVSVSSANPELIKEAVKNITGREPDEGVLVGAGIKTNEDLEKALKLGAAGVLISSGIVKARNAEEALKELIKWQK